MNIYNLIQTRLSITSLIQKTLPKIVCLKCILDITYVSPPS